MVSRTKLAVVMGSVMLLSALLALGLASVSAAPGVDLVINKWSDPYAPGPVVPGEELFYHISVYNNGDDTATNVLVTDTLPYAVSYIDDTDNCAYNSGLHRLVCDLGQLVPGQGSQFDIKVRVDPWAVMEEGDNTTVLENTAVVGSSEEDDDPSDNTVTHSIFAEGSADLMVTKMSKPDTQVRAGELFTYTIYVDNLGPSVAEWVGVRDELLSSGAFEIVSWSTDRSAYDMGGCGVESTEPGISNTLDCELHYLEPRGVIIPEDYGEYPLDTGRWTISVVVRANETQDLNDVAEVFPLDFSELAGYPVFGTPDPNLSNNTAEDFIYVTDVADLSMDKYLDGCDGPLGDCVAGGQAGFIIDVANNGPSMAENVVVEDFLPAGVTVTYVEGDGACNTGIPGDPFHPLTCNLGNIPAGEGRSFYVNVVIDPDYPLQYEGGEWIGYLENDAWVYSDIFDPDNGNNRDHVILPIGAYSNLDAWKQCPQSVVAGQEFDYVVSFQNYGPSTLHNLFFNDPLHEGLTFLDYEILLGDGTCYYNADQHTLGCSLGDVDAGESVAVKLTVRVRPDYDQTLVYNDLAGAYWADTPFDIGEGWPYCETEVQLLTDLSITKTSEPMKIYPGEQKLYHIEVTNNGTMNAVDVIVTDTLPAEVDYEIDNDNCDLMSEDPDVLECHLGTIPGGQTVGFDISALVQPGYFMTQTVEIANTAVVSMPYDTNPDNNIATATNLILLPTSADMSLEKRWGEAPPEWFQGGPYGPEDCFLYDEGLNLYGIRAGCPLTFSLTVGNTGPLAAENVVVEDVMPAGVTLEGVGSSQGSCTTGIPGDPANPLICNLGNIPRDEGAGITVFARADVNLAWEHLQNDAVVSSDIPDPDEGNNRAHVLIWVEPFSFMYLDKDGPPEITAGEEIHYWINLRNEGPSTAHDVYVDDELPGGVSLLGAEVMIGEGSCEPDSALCSLGDLEPGQNRAVRVRGHVEPGIEPESIITNTARAWANSPFFQPVPDQPISDTVETLVHSAADLSIWKTSDPYKVYAGEQKRYDIEVTNYGPSVARNVVVSDTLPAEVEFEISTADCGGSPLTCPLGDIPPGETRNFSIFVQVKPDTLGIINNQVEVSSDNDPNPGNNWDSEANLVMGRADLRVEKYGPSGPVEAPGPLIYTIVVDNLGTGYAHDVVLNDLFSWNDLGGFYYPEWYIEGVDSDRPADCDTQYSGYYWEEARITCHLEDPLEMMSPASSGRWVVKIFVDVFEDASATNVADVVGSDYDPDLSNNRDIANNDVEPVTDLQVMKWAWGEIPDDCDQPPYPTQHDRVAAGATMWYEVQVCNMGPSVAENVVLEDWGISPLLDITDVSWDMGMNCVKSELGEQGDTNRRLTCYLGYLPDWFNYGDPYCKSLYIEADVPSDVPEGTVLLNEAHTYGDLYDHQNWNNFTTNDTTVEVWADLAVEKTQEPEIALPGQDIAYTITVVNEGPSDAEGVFISDTTPVQVLNPTWSCCASDDGQCDVPCEPPICPPGVCPWPDPATGLFAQADIPANEWVIYTIEGTLDWWPCGPFTNTVELLPPQSLLYPEMDIDPCDENNVSEAVNDPFCHYDPLALKEYPEPDSPP